MTLVMFSFTALNCSLTPYDIDHSSVTYDGSTLDSIATYQCDHGYTFGAPGNTSFNESSSIRVSVCEPTSPDEALDAEWRQVNDTCERKASKNTL